MCLFSRDASNRIFIAFAILVLAGQFLPGQSLEARITGRVVKVSDGMVFIDAGRDKGVQPGGRFEILQRRSDGVVENMGILSVEQVFDRSSLGTPVLLLPGRTINSGDMIFEYREAFYRTLPIDTRRALSIRSKWIRSSEDNLDVIVAADIAAGTDIYRAYCIYRYGEKAQWNGMALYPLEERDSFYYGYIPESELREGEIEYYIVVVDVNDRIAYSGNQENPHRAMVYFANPYFSDQAQFAYDAGRRKGVFPWIIVPGATQIRNKETLKGIALFGLETAAVAAGVAAHSDKAAYYGAAGLVYVFNIADGLLNR